MDKDTLDDQTWDNTLGRLKSGQIPAEEIAHTIVRLGKPFDQSKIIAAKDTVAQFLNHPDSWVRHEAMWFLTAWGRLKEYQSALIQAIRTDPDVDNRSFAATCLGRLEEGTGEPNAVSALKSAVEDEILDPLLRLY